MTSLLRRALSGTRDVLTIEDYAQALNTFTFQGNTYAPTITQSYGNPQLIEQVRRDFASYVANIYASNGVVFALMAVRQMAFSQIRMQFQTLNKGRPGDLYSTPELGIFETPWVGGTTQDLLSKMITDVDLAGNCYLTISGGEIVRLRPDWVDIVLKPRTVQIPDAEGGFKTSVLGLEKAGYVYWEGGRGEGFAPVPLMPDEVSHWAPLTDPMATYRGMSWLTPLLREIQSDKAMEEHKFKFFERAATPNMVIKHGESETLEDMKRFKLAMDAEYGGVLNAWKTMHLGGGADVTVVGADFKQMDFKVVQGHGETRVAAAAGVPPIIPGFSEGLSSATYSNYGQALRRFAGLTMHPLWKSAVGSLQSLVKTHPGSRLWYDTRDVEFLREDAQDLAEVQQTQAATISSYISAGFTPDSATAAVINDDINLLVHTGLVSVQLWVPGAQDTTTPAPGSGGSTDTGTTGSGKKKTKQSGGKSPDATPPQAQGVYG